MKTVFVITVSGVDKPGIIDNLVEASSRLGAEVLSSKAMRLDGQMAALLKVALLENQKENFTAELSGAFTDVQFSYGQAITAADSTGRVNRINLVVDCTNRPGVQDELNEILERLALKVESMECSRCRVPGIGETVFSARCALVAPEYLKGERIAVEIETLAVGARVNVI
jgi:glycine cleavage system regulatory protein